MKRSTWNPLGPFSSRSIRWLEAPEPEGVVVQEERAKSVLSRNDSPDLPFRYSVNPYRGCGHACAYCYARPSHEYLDLGAGADFDRKLIVKINAPEQLALELAPARFRNEVVALCGSTDPYQPIEARYRLTRQMLKVFLQRATPVCIVTKGALIRRDLDLLTQLAERELLRIYLSIPFLDSDLARKFEPGAPTPTKRFEVLESLHKSGIPVGVSLAPLIPGLNEEQLPGLLEAAANAGATSAFTGLLRLPGSTREVFFERLERLAPARAQKVRNGLLEARDGHLEESRFGHRQSGTGPRYRAAMDLFLLTARRLGLETYEPGQGRFEAVTGDGRTTDPAGSSGATNSTGVSQGELFPS